MDGTQRFVEMKKRREDSFIDKLIKQEIDVKSLNDRILLLEKEKEEYLLKDISLKEQIEKLEQDLVFLNSNETSNLKTPLEEAVKNYVANSTFYLHSIFVGEEQFIELNSTKPEANIAAHIKKAKEGSKNLIHVKLRQFGYLNEYSLVKEFQNEILGLVSEIILIKKNIPSLNENNGGLSLNYKIVEDLNEFNESVYFVINRNVEKLEENKIKLIKDIKDKTLEKSEIPTKIQKADEAIEYFNGEYLSGKEIQRQKSKWGQALAKYNAKNFVTTYENGFIDISVVSSKHLVVVGLTKLSLNEGSRIVKLAAFIE